MKKSVLLALIIVITTAFVFAAFQAPTNGFAFSVETSPNVNWSTGVFGFNAMAEPAQSVAFVILPLPIPNIGWNS